MSENARPTLSRWPFLLGDLLLLAAGAGVAWLAHTGRLEWSPALAALLVAAVALGGWMLVTPFLREHAAAVRLEEQAGLAGTLQQIQQLRNVAAQVTAAGTQFQAAQESATRTQAAAGELLAAMQAERQSFTQFLQQANDQDRQALRLEVEKLHRGEQEMLQVVVVLLDHSYALLQAAVRSGHQGIVQQLAHFRHACLDTVRRLGLVALEARPGEEFNAQLHEWAQPRTATPGTRIGRTVACGYTFRGVALRRIIVDPPEPPPAVSTGLAIPDPLPGTGEPAAPDSPGDEPEAAQPS